MPTYEVNAPDGQKFRVNAPDGATQDDAIAYVQKQFYGAKSIDMPEGAGQKLNGAIADIPRQLGLTARYGLEGVGGTLDMLASPIRYGLNKALPESMQIAGNTGASIADKLGLPTAQTKVEKVAEEATKMMAGGGALLKGAQLASNAPGMVGKVGGLLAENPAAQLEANAGAGTAGGYVKETGGNPLAQFAASVAGGIAAPISVAAVKGIPGAAKSAVEYLAPGLAKPQNLDALDVTISKLIEPSGITLGDLNASVRNQLREDVAKAMKSGGQLDYAALRRLADYRMVGATPTRATISLDPADITRQKNAAKFGINSADPKLQQLGQIENANNRAIIEKLNSIENPQGDSISSAYKVMDRLNALNSAKKAEIDAAYEAARGTSGRYADIDPYAFTQRASDMLDEAMLGSVLPVDVRNKLNQFAAGELPLNVNIAEQFKTQLGNLARNSNDKSVQKALGMVRQALDDAPLMNAPKVNPGNLPVSPANVPPSPSVLGQESIDAFNHARGLNRDWMNVVDKVPALQAVRDGVEPDNFVQDFIIGNGTKASVMDVAKLKTLIKDSPEAMQAVRGQMISFLKSKALGSASDEFGNVSQSNLNKALQSIGERKLRLFFDQSELEGIKAAARVASYEQVQPRGSAVNNSNTAGTALATLFDKLANSPLVGKIPLAPQMAGNISASIAARRALNAPSGAVMPQQKSTVAPYLLPSFSALGLLTE